MNRGGENSDSIPIDLIMEILSRLTAKSIARFRCVSKLWGSMLSRPYFTEMFLTRSSARPRLLFAVERAGECCFYSSPPESHNPYEKSSFVVSADFHMKFPRDMCRLENISDSVSGFIYFPNMQISKDYKDTVPVSVICNPSMAHYVSLPKGRMKRDWNSFLGFDPVEKKLKLLSMMFPLYDENEPAQILTLGTENVSWRTIFSPLSHFPLREGVCINGVLYYLAIRTNVPSLVIVCFDVRSEKFKFIETNCFSNEPSTRLINYKGKLAGVITSENDDRSYLWVLEDVEKSDSLDFVYALWKNEIVGCDVSFVGVTATGEIVLAEKRTSSSKPFYVFYYNPEKKSLQSVEIQGFGANHEAFENPSRVRVFINHVENLNFIT